MIILFTFLTYYSATYDKVTDCGCFGDAIKLTPWQSFYKDLILLVSSLIILMGLRHIKSIFNTPFTVKVLTVFTLLSIGFAMYCWYYLPVMNFLKFKKGNDIEFLATVPEGAPTDEYAFTFIYEKDGKQERFSEAEMAEKNPKANGYKFVDRIDTLIKKGYEPEIHDFAIMDETRNNDYIDDFFADKNAKLFIVIKEVETARPKAIKQLAKYLKPWKKKGHSVYILTASNVESVEAFRHEYQLTEPFYYGDKTNLKSIIRSNPGLLLFKGNVVEGTWPSTRLPSIETLLQMADD
jgi:hypothetical protein